MTVAEIKERYRLPEVLRSEGVEINRAGFCHCIYHNEKTASMKVWNDHAFSFCCQKNSDVIDVIRALRGLSFVDACEYLSGEELTKETTWSIALSAMRERDRTRKRERAKRRLRFVNESISFYRRTMELADEFLKPMSDKWCDAYGNAVRQYDRLCYLQDELLRELK